jgi:predicted DNA-binding transcriptional regulator AlpA
MEYEFEFKFKLPAQDADAGALVERLGAAGCEDALIGVGQPGRIALQFTREADSAKQAILGALEEVKNVIPGAELIEAGPDFVGLTDVAQLLGVSRQNMRKLMLTHTASFPSPVHEGSAAVWHLEPVLRWLKERGDYAIEQSQIDVAHMAMQVNLVREVGRLELPIQDQIRKWVA